MQISLSQIASAVFGAVKTEEKNGNLVCRRFDETQCGGLMPFDRLRSESCAGMRIDFVTDSDFFAFSFRNAWLSCRRGFYFFDLLVNSCLMAHEGLDLGQDDTQPKPPVRPLPDADYRFDLGKGEKRVTLVLPQIAYLELTGFALSDGASFVPVLPKRKIVSFGDSITEGMDARYPSFHYLHRTALAFDAELHNLAIAGGRFDPSILDGKLPDAHLVTVAYGTNDFRRSSAEVFYRDMPLFLERIARRYFDTQVFILLPFYRKTVLASRYEIGTMDEVREAIRKEAARYPAFQVIESKFFVPPIPDFFGDGRLHPNELGNASIADHLILEIKKRLNW